MKNIELADLRNHEYMLRHIIAHMHYWREGSNWIVQEGGRSNTAVMALLSVGADYLDVGTHELLASACPGDLVITPLHMRYEFRVHSAVDSMSSISHLPNSSFYYNGMKHEVFSEGQLANAIFIGFEMQDHLNEPLTVCRHIEVLRFKESDDLLKRIEYIARAAGSGFFPPALIAAKTYELLTSLSDRAHNLTLRTTAYRRIEPALRYIDNHPIGSTSVSALSEQCCLSPSCFRKLFRQEMGVSPVRYIQERTLNRAQKLLIGSDLSIAETAIECGFRDVFYFSRFFRKMTGLSPSLWRETEKANGNLYESNAEYEITGNSERRIRHDE